MLFKKQAELVMTSLLVLMLFIDISNMISTQQNKYKYMSVGEGITCNIFTIYSYNQCYLYITVLFMLRYT